VIKKYEHVFERIHQYIYNRIQVESDDLKIAREIVAQYPTYIAFFKCDSDMIEEMIYQSVCSSRLTRRVLEGNYEATIEALKSEIKKLK